MNRYTELLGDIKDGSKFKHSLDPYEFPFIIFYDELETGNPLGSREGVNILGAFYISLRCFPPHIYCELQNIYIYIVMLIPSNKQNLAGALKYLADEINVVQNNGIQVGGKYLMFIFTGFVGDNLGLHQIMGFSKGFAANFPCRMCKASKETVRKMTIEQLQTIIMT